MEDKILTAFLRRQHDEAMALAEASDLLDLIPLERPEGDRHDRYIAQFRCNGLVKTAADGVIEANHFALGIWIPPDYLVRADPYAVLTWFEPWAVFHPNIRPPFICLGRIAPGTPLVDLLYQCYEIISYAKVTMREDDALNKEACAWARQNLHRFPIDRRPLKRRALALEIDPAGERRRA